MTKVFIDGEAGTTGLQIADRVRTRNDLTLLRIDERQRKDADARARLLEEADVAILCLPDDAAREAVALAGERCRILDASTAHRVNPDWVYGLPELEPGARERIACAQRVSNPGCYPQGFILLTRPLIEAGVLPRDLPLRIHAVSGYSGGGRSLIETYQGFDAETRERYNTRPYALGLTHKHVPEMQHYSGCAQAPLFAPLVGDYYQGMLVHVPLFTSELNGRPTPEDVHGLLAERYADEAFVDVLPPRAADALEAGFLDPSACNRSNRIELMVFGHSEQLLLVARLDNLGKGAAGAAVQNLNLMIGVDETTGLTR
ncbi:MAG: N-acetyl-gamma-glutamyl-phosphate reductase [Pseudomonadales bacterium]